MAENQSQQSRAWVGVICGLFLGIFGLLFIFCFPAGSYERDTFVKGWLWTFIIALIIEIIMTILYFTVFAALIAGTAGAAVLL